MTETTLEKLGNDIVMSSMHPSTPGLLPNQDLREPALTEAIKFTSELIFLGVLHKATPLIKSRATFHCFSFPNHHNEMSYVILRMSLIQYIHYGWTSHFSRLLVIIVVDFLQSLVPATPVNIVASFL